MVRREQLGGVKRGDLGVGPEWGRPSHVRIFDRLEKFSALPIPSKPRQTPPNLRPTAAEMSSSTTAPSAPPKDGAAPAPTAPTSAAPQAASGESTAGTSLPVSLDAT